MDDKDYKNYKEYAGNEDYEKEMDLDVIPSSKKLTPEEQRAITQEAKKNSLKWYQVFSDNVENYKNNLAFALGQQYDSGTLVTLREFQQKPFTSNKIYPNIRQIIGEFIQNSPDIEVFSTTGTSSDEMMKFYQDLYNTVSYHSRGRTIWKDCIKQCLMGGFSALKVKHGYFGDYSREQQIYIEGCVDPTRIFFDPGAKEKSKCDGEFWGEKYTISLSELFSQYPDFDASELDDDAAINFGKDSIEFKEKSFQTDATKRVEITIYQRREYYKENFIEVASGKLWSVDEYEQAFDEYINAQISVAKAQLPFVDEKELYKQVKSLRLPENLRYIKKVKRTCSKIRSYKICCNRVLEHSDWMSKKFGGYVFVDCDSYWYDGKQITRSFLTDAKDSQVMHNMAQTKIYYEMECLRGERWIGTSEHVAGFEDEWSRVDNVLGLLRYNPVIGVPGVPPRPEQIPPAPVNPSLFQIADKAEQDIYTCLGIGQAWRGQAGGNYQSETSMKKEIGQTDKGTAIYFDGVYDAMTQVGKVIFDSVPNIYDTQRLITLINKQGEIRTVEINKMDSEGNIKLDLSKANYDIAVKTGLSFEMQREQAFKVLTQLASVGGPQTAMISMDKIAESLGFPGSQELARRYKATIPPQILAAGEGKELPPPPPEQPNPMIQLEMQKLQQKQAELDVKKEGLRVDIERLQAEILKLQQNTQLQQMKAQVEMEKAAMDFQARQEARLDKQADRLRKNATILTNLGIKYEE